MPHLVQLDHDGAALGLGLLGVHFGEALDPGLDAGRRHAEQLGGAVHRQPAQVQQHRLDLDPQRHAARRRVGEVQPAGLAAVALLAAHEPVLDVLLGPAPLAPQSHPLTPCTVPPSVHIGNLCGPETLLEFKAKHKNKLDDLREEIDKLYEEVISSPDVSRKRNSLTYDLEKRLQALFSEMHS